MASSSAHSDGGGDNDVVQILRPPKPTSQEKQTYRKRLQSFAVCALNGHKRVRFCTNMNMEEFLPFIPELVQCSLPMKVVAAAKDATADGVHHIVRVGSLASDAACNIYEINPLPQGHVALAKIPDLTGSDAPSTGPWKRHGPRREPMEINQVLPSLRQLSVNDITADPHSQVVIPPQPPAGVVAGHVCEPPEESANIEFKMTKTEIEHVLDKLVADRLSYHGEPLLNAHGPPPTRLFIGVHENTAKQGLYIGVCLSGTKDPLKETNAWVKGLFPPLPSNSVRLVLHPVGIQFAEGDMDLQTAPHIQWVPATTAIKQLVKLEGRAHVFKQKQDASADVQQESALQLRAAEVSGLRYALACSESEKQALEQEGHARLDRHVVEVQLQLSDSQVYFRTEQPHSARSVDKQEDKHPYPVCTSALFLPHLAGLSTVEFWNEVCEGQRSLPVLDGCGMWLRSRFQGSTDVGAELCSDASIVVLLKTGNEVWDQDVLSAVCAMYGMLPDRLDLQCSLDASDSRVGQLARMLHVKQRSRVFMIVGLQQQQEQDPVLLFQVLPVQLKEQLLKRAHSAAPLEFVAVLPADAAPQAAVVLKCLNSPETPLADVIVPPFGDGVAGSTGVDGAHTHQNDLSLPHFRLMEHTNCHPQPRDGSLERWLEAGGSHLTWPLVYHNFVPQLPLYDSLLKRLLSLLAESGKVHRHMVRKLHLCCGATTTLRVLACKLAMQADKAPLVFFAEAHKEARGPDLAPDTRNFDSGDDDESGVISGKAVAAISVDNEWIEEVRPLLVSAKQHQRNIVFLVDERSAITAATVCKLCDSVFQRRDTSAVVVVEVVSNGRRVDGVGDTLVDPFLPRDAATLVARQLSHRFKQSTSALEALITHIDRSPSAGSQRKLDHHLFVFGLTARNGTFAPADKLAASIVTEAQKVHDDDFPALHFVLALSYLGAFAVCEPHSQLPLQRTEAARSKVAEFVKQLPALQPLLVWDDPVELCRLCHPLLSRLLFVHAADGGQTQIALKKPHFDRHFLAKTHTVVGAFIAAQFTGKGSTDSRRARALDIIVRRHQGRWFSPLLAQFAMDAPRDERQESEDLRHLRTMLHSTPWPVEEGYALLQEARVLRQWSTVASHTTAEGNHPKTQRFYDRLTTLKQRAVTVAHKAHETLNTFDSQCNLVSCLAHQMGKEPKNRRLDDFEAQKTLYLARRQQLEAALDGLWMRAGETHNEKVQVVQLAVRHLGQAKLWVQRSAELGVQKDISSMHDPTDFVLHWRATGYWSFGHHFIEGAV